MASDSSEDLFDTSKQTEFECCGLQYFAKRNETKRNGTLRNGTLRNGTLRNGTLRNGTLRNAYTTQRFITPYLEYLEFH